MSAALGRCLDRAHLLQSKRDDSMFDASTSWTARSVRSRSARLSQRLRAGETLVRHAALDDAQHGRMLVDGALEHAIASGMADKAQVRHGDLIAMTIGARRLVTREMVLVGVETGGEPVPHPGDPALLVEVERGGEMAAHTRHDQRMRVG